eukprot:3379922-Pyramimonas_sp.AAC.1
MTLAMMVMTKMVAMMLAVVIMLTMKRRRRSATRMSLGFGQSWVLGLGVVLVSPRAVLGIRS